MVTEIELFESPELALLDFIMGWMKMEVYEIKVDTREDLLARI
jgi:hypothetical protein